MKNIIKIKEEVQIGDTILEKGDKIQVLKEYYPDHVFTSTDDKWVLELFKNPNGSVKAIEVYKRNIPSSHIVFEGKDEIN